MIYQTHIKCCFYLKCKHKYFQIEIKTNMSMNLMLSNFVGYIYKGYIRQFVKTVPVFTRKLNDIFIAQLILNVCLNKQLYILKKNINSS